MNDLEERKTKAIKEIHTLLDRSISEEQKITEELKRKGALTPGLDGNSKDYAPQNKEFKIRVKEVFTKYNLPPDTRLKLW